MRDRLVHDTFGQAFKALASTSYRKHPNHIPPWRGAYHCRRPRQGYIFLDIFFFFLCWVFLRKEDKIAKAKRESSERAGRGYIFGQLCGQRRRRCAFGSFVWCFFWG